MRKPTIIETDEKSYKFKLPFSALIKLRDEGIDFFEQGLTAIMEDIGRLYQVFQVGISSAEHREISHDEVVDIVDEILEVYSLGDIYEIILASVSIKGVYDRETEILEATTGDEEIDELIKEEEEKN